MLIKTAFITKKTGFVFRSYQRKGFNSKKTGFIWRQHTQKKIDLIKTGFTSIKTVFTKSFFSARAQKKEKKREGFLPTAKSPHAISKILFILGSYTFLAYLECIRSYAWSFDHSDLSSVIPWLDK